jgi:Protein of unknown function (DUF2730)
MSDELAKEIRHFSVLMEDQNKKLDAVLEGISALPTRDDFHRLEDDIAELKGDMKTIKVAVKATNHDLEQHKSLTAHVAHGRA